MSAPSLARMSSNIDTWMTEIKDAFMTTLEESEVPLSYIEIAKKLKLKEHDEKNWFAMGVIGELFETGKVEKELKHSKTKYKITGRVYVEQPEQMEDISEEVLKSREDTFTMLSHLGNHILKAQCRAAGVSLGVVDKKPANKQNLIERLRVHEQQKRKLLED